jgi:hypothetical protein
MVLAGSAKRGATASPPTVSACCRPPPSSRKTHSTCQLEAGLTGKREKTSGAPKTMSRAGLSAGMAGEAGTVSVGTCHVEREANQREEAPPDAIAFVYGAPPVARDRSSGSSSDSLMREARPTSIFQFSMTLKK